MTRYYFDLVDSDGITTDDEGIDLPSMQRVQEEAGRSLADMARDAVVRLDRNAIYMAIEVRDNSGPVMHLKFTFEIDRKRQEAVSGRQPVKPQADQH